MIARNHACSNFKSDKLKAKCHTKAGHYFLSSIHLFLSKESELCFHESNKLGGKFTDDNEIRVIGCFKSI